MKNQIRKIQHYTEATALLTKALLTSACLIPSKVFAFNHSGGFRNIVGVNDNDLSTAVFYKSYPDGSFFPGKTTTCLAFYLRII